MLGSPPQSTPTLHHGTSPSATVLPSVPSFPGNSSTSHCASAHPSRSSFVLFRLAAAVLLVLSALLAAYLAHTIICATAAFLGSSNEVRQLTRKDVHADSNVRDQFSPVMDNQPHNPEHERPISAQRFDFQAISTSRFGPLVDVLYINRDMSCAASPVAVLMFSTATLAAEGISCFLGQVRQNAQALLFRMPQRQSIEWRRTVVVLFALALRTRLPLPDPILESSVRLVSNVTLLLLTFVLLRTAWRALRFKIPTIGTRPSVLKSPSNLGQRTSPKSHSSPLLAAGRSLTLGSPGGLTNLQMDHLRNLRDSVEFGQSSLDPRRTSPPSGRSFGSAYFSTGSPSLGRAADVLDADDAQSVLGNLKLSGDHGNSRDFSLSSTAKEDPVGWPSQHHATGHLRKRLWRDVDPDDDDDGTDEEVEGESHRSPFEQGSNFAKPLKFSQPSVFRTSSSQAGTSKQPLELGPQQFFRPEEATGLEDLFVSKFRLESDEDHKSQGFEDLLRRKKKVILAVACVAVLAIALLVIFIGLVYTYPL